MTRFRALLLIGPLLVSCGTRSDGSPPAEVLPVAASAMTGFYTTTQADRGRGEFRRVCLECHATNEFSGQDFEWTWRRRTAWNLYNEISSTMPEDDPGGLASQTYADIIGYILQLNEYAVGQNDLLPSKDAMERVPLGPGADKTGTKAAAKQ